jgi:hypothetical protein
VADDDVLNELVAQLGLAVQPLVDATSSADAMNAFLQRLGWDLDPAPAVITALQAPASQVYALVEGGDEVDSAALIGGVRAAFTAISDISAGGAGLPAGFAEEFPRQLVDYLLFEYLIYQQPRWGYLLLTLGIIRTEPVAAAPPRLAFVRKVVAYEDFGGLVSDPLTFFRNGYKWGTSDFRGLDFQLAVAGLADAWGAEVRQTMLEPDTAAQLKVGAIAPTAALDTVIRLVLLHSESLVALEAGVGLFMLPETAAAKPGFAVLPYGTAGIHEGIDLSDMVRLVADGTVQLDGGVGALVRPDKDIELLTGFGPGTPSSASGTVSIALRVGKEGEPTVLIGTADASHFELLGASALGGARFHSSGKYEVYVELGVQGAKIVIKPGPDDSDSFLETLLPGDGLSIGTDLTVGFSTTQGLYFGGSGGLEINLPAHISLGPIEIQGAMIAVRFRDGGIPIELGATIKGDLSVLTAVVENIGLTATITFPADQKGNLGPANLALGFKPPNGVGLSIDAGVVKGGGYLYLDFDKGEYAGALELTVADFLSLKAIGLISTKLPGGQPGFSMLVIITAEFSPGFQLGYGFTLIGVGGLLGLNRGMLLEPMAAGVRTGAINGILFPTNVIENAPRIISDLRAIFPPKEGTFLIGPMAKIGWGTPTLVSVSLGVIIEIPGNVVILGRLKLALPTEDEALIVLQVTFIGALEFDKRRIWFFASLFESRILFITLDGEMGLLMDYSDNPNFLLSIGGFHPRFTPPPLPFPSPNRLALSIIDESFARIRIDTYFAVTTNTVQLGAHAEAYFGFSALSVEGHFGFDALVRFSPFYLIVEISCGFSVKVFGLGVWGIQLRGSLEGPTPWHISGSATISLLFFDISVDIDETFGERRADVLPPLPVLPALRTELEKHDSWRATLPATGRLLVSLRELGDPDLLVLHPLGTLQVGQRFVPLGLPLDKVGNQKPSDIKKASVSIDPAGGLSVRGPMRDRFAIAQYRNLDDAAKLSAPAFELLESGVELGAAGNPWVTGPAATRTVRYESIIVDTAYERFPLRYFEFWGELFVHFAAGASVSRSALSRANERKRQPFEEKVTVKDAGFVVAHQSDNTAFADSAFGSHAEATAYLHEAIAADPGLADSIHILPASEVSVFA